MRRDVAEPDVKGNRILDKSPTRLVDAEFRRETATAIARAKSGFQSEAAFGMSTIYNPRLSQDATHFPKTDFYRRGAIQSCPLFSGRKYLLSIMTRVLIAICDRDHSRRDPGRKTKDEGSFAATNSRAVLITEKRSFAAVERSVRK